MLWIYFDINTAVPSSQHPSAHWAHLLHKPITLSHLSPFWSPFFLHCCRVCRLPGGGESEEDLRGPALWGFGRERRREYHRAVQKEEEYQDNALPQAECWNPCGELQFFRVFIQDLFTLSFYHRVLCNDRKFVDPIYCSTLWIHLSIIICHANETHFYVGVWRMTSGAWWHSGGYSVSLARRQQGEQTVAVLGVVF